MTYIEVQAMRKKAAAFPWKKWVTNIGSSLGISDQKNNAVAPHQAGKTRSQAYHDLNVKPYDTAEDFQRAGFDPARAGDRAHMGALPALYWNDGNTSAGHIPWTYSQGAYDDINGPSWAYKVYKQKPYSDGYNEADSVSFNIYPNHLPNYRYGQQLRRATAGYRQQPLNMMQLMSMQAGDTGYVDKLLKHYMAVDPAYWRAANLKLSSPSELEKWKESVPGLGPEVEGSSTYNSGDNAIRLTSNRNRLSDYDDFVNNRGRDLTGSPLHIAQPSALRDSLFRSRYSPDAADAEAFFHELNHRNSMGSSKVVYRPYPHGESTPFEDGGIATLMRPEIYKGLYLTPEQIKWLQKHDIEPFAVNENEMNQALLSFNAGRYRLQKDMLENPNNPNYKQLNENVRKTFTDFPQFLQPGEEGAKQLDELMSFYDKNPQFIAMMPEQSRLVGYYKNLKAAINNSDDPVEKEFFQNMLNRMIYSKSFLADSRKRPNMSYTDVQRMRA